jgi:ATP-dependent DNA helicase DinG
MALHASLDSFFAANGPLAKHLPGYAPRSAQIEMAHHIADCLVTKKGRVAVEAGTGTGKSMAYLAAALLGQQHAHVGPVVVTTGTKALQDQLYTKDVPLALAAVADLLGENDDLGADPAVLMKGRQNYLCKLRFERFSVQPLFAFSAEAPLFKQITGWSTATSTGDRAEMSFLPDHFAAWSDLDAGSETCLGMRCKDYEQCWVVRMRRRADGARLVVANHHLLCADLRLRLETRSAHAANGDSGARVLPEAGAYVIDEAHALADVASDSFGISVGSHALSRLLGDVRRFADGLGGDDRAAVLDGMSDAEEQLERLMAPLAGRERDRERLRLPQGTAALRDGASAALASLTKTLENIADEALTAVTLGSGVAKVAGDPIMRSAERMALARRAATAKSEIDFVLGRAFDDARFVVLAEPSKKGAKVTAAPVDVAAALEQTLFALEQPVVLTSATLATASGKTPLASFLARIGLAPETAGAVLSSPFDFKKRGALYCPRDMPEPSDPGFFERFIDEGRFLLETTRGGALFLFTSTAAMDEGFRALLPVAVHLGIPALKQGDMHKGRLLEELRKHTDDTGALLCATRSFWEGVDVRGRALRLVVVDRLPFDVPTDPLRVARAELCKQRGGDPFRDIALPEAALALKQGAGRLLRDVDDAGIVAILDGRLRKKSYGSVFLDTLPPLTRIGARPALAEFFRRFIQPMLGLSAGAPP